MAATYTVEELQDWNERIIELVEQFGLDPYPQEFEICDYEQMLSYMVYSGMPSHYPHWSYGKAFEKLKTLWSYFAYPDPETAVSDAITNAFLASNDLDINALLRAIFNRPEFYSAKAKNGLVRTPTEFVVT